MSDVLLEVHEHQERVYISLSQELDGVRSGVTYPEGVGVPTDYAAGSLRYDVRGLWGFWLYRLYGSWAAAAEPLRVTALQVTGDASWMTVQDRAFLAGLEDEIRSRAKEGA